MLFRESFWQSNSPDSPPHVAAVMSRYSQLGASASSSTVSAVNDDIQLPGMARFFVLESSGAVKSAISDAARVGGPNILDKADQFRLQTIDWARYEQ